MLPEWEPAPGIVDDLQLDDYSPLMTMGDTELLVRAVRISAAECVALDAETRRQVQAVADRRTSVSSQLPELDERRAATAVAGRLLAGQVLAESTIANMVALTALRSALKHVDFDDWDLWQRSVPSRDYAQWPPAATFVLNQIFPSTAPRVIRSDDELLLVVPMRTAKRAASYWAMGAKPIRRPDNGGRE